MKGAGPANSTIKQKNQFSQVKLTAQLKMNNLSG